MPNGKAKDRKRKRYLKNEQLKKQGRTAKQYKKYLAKSNKSPVF